MTMAHEEAVVWLKTVHEVDAVWLKMAQEEGVVWLRMGQEEDAVRQRTALVADVVFRTMDHVEEEQPTHKKTVKLVQEEVEMNQQIKRNTREQRGLLKTRLQFNISTNK